MLSRGREISLCAVNTCARQWVVLVGRGFILLEVEAWPEAEAFSFVTCTSVLNLKPLPYQTALTKPLMNVEPLTMQKTKTKQKNHTHTHTWAGAGKSNWIRQTTIHSQTFTFFGLFNSDLFNRFNWIFSHFNSCRNLEFFLDQSMPVPRNDIITCRSQFKYSLNWLCEGPRAVYKLWTIFCDTESSIRRL